MWKILSLKHEETKICHILWENWGKDRVYEEWIHPFHVLKIQVYIQWLES